ncbi:cytochrome-c oxidase, cbb3-type subunit III [Sinimarinibacterium sp. CAU 1509]|uniref:cytochrome-c oxidase, cbb3-type subunit III n=1 Tax=Sinimarinibacterium sp. CAU 1509 TaxID=2562283 RepID=UPI0010AD8704|nr:cytochrome-c oxidase, cbb3-type subunit III [Sinimarinibacterium sp. CAU 1509]TJY63007.1 cytochrome-c oxidase, cbb3-type subunit III [Sinimarinibacterium sp. CAU 1509]
MSTFWSLFIIVISVGSMLGSLWLLFSNARGKMSTEDTGHVWDDDLRENNNPLPRWWLNLFVLTVIFAAIYLAFYPGLGNFAGTLGWTSNKQLAERLQVVEAKREALFSQFRDQDPGALSKNAAALSLGRDVFLNNCAGCHGADAKGAVGFPNLTDHDWLYGGTPETIVATITNGRNGMMPALGPSMDKATLDAVVQTVAHWNDPKLDPAIREKGMAQFNITCMACHGPTGTGNPILGAPNLTDNIWLYGGSTDRIRETLMKGRQGKMPPHQPLLSADEIKVVAAYVYSLSQN